MNEKSQPAAPDLCAGELRGADLRGKNLTGFEGLLPEHLAGTILTGAKLSDDIAKFPALEQVKAISSEARKIFIGLLAACVYSWLVIGTTTDKALILNTASSPLPIINTPVPIAHFYVVAAALLAAVYCYFHFYLLRLWRTLATLPAVFPDGTALDDRTDPWLLTNLVCLEFPHLRANAPPLARLETLLSVFLAWFLVPVTLIALWVRYLPAHYWLGTTCLVLLIGLTTLFGRHTFRLTKATLRGGAVPGVNAGRADGNRGIVVRAMDEIRRLRPDKLTVRLAFVLSIVSLSAFVDSPRSRDYWTIPRTLNLVGIRTYADLREVDVAERPDGWTGNEYLKVQRVDLRGRNLAFADLTRAFLPNADLRRANLNGAVLESAELQGADLSFAGLQRANLAGANFPGTYLIQAQLQGANLEGAVLQNARLSGARAQSVNLRNAQLPRADLGDAWLQSADLRGAQLQRANLREAQLQGADLVDAQLQSVDFRGARLQGANLSRARLEGADLSGAGLQAANLTFSNLEGANLSRAELQGAYLTGAQLQGADLRNVELQGAVAYFPQIPLAANFGGADLRQARLWRAAVATALWDLADLRGSTVRPMSDPDIDALIGKATMDIQNEDLRQTVTEVLTAALRTEERLDRPDFPKDWEKTPNVMFQLGDPQPEPFNWGPPKWDTKFAYDDALADFLGDLACDPDVPEPQTRGLARRALDPDNRNRAFAQRLAARLVGDRCPRAKEVPEPLRHQLEQLAARGGAAGEGAGR